MEKIDPYKQKEKYLSWKDKRDSELEGITDYNRNIFFQYMSDMETGINVASIGRKGSRSFIRLNTLRIRIHAIMKEFESRFNLEKTTDVSEEQLHFYFSSMRNGQITKKGGGIYRSVDDFVKDFKAFWHWWMKINKKQDIEIRDITEDLDSSKEKPRWVYLTEEQVKQLAENSTYEYKALIWFLFDAGIRAPTELINVRVSDFFNDFKELNIRQEASKTFGRRIKLMLSSTLIKEYAKNKKLKLSDQIFNICPPVANRYLKRMAEKVFGDGVSPAGEKYSRLTMYDLRHCSCCYWLPRYKSESALKYRFGWKESDKIHYYSELLGMSDTISQDDMLIDLTKTEIEQKLQKSEKEKEIMQERMKTMELQMAKINELIERGMIIITDKNSQTKCKEVN